jgi:uncharacterized YigZ family protein
VTAASRTEKGSRFLASLIPVTSENAARDSLALIAKRYPDATHHCWALRLARSALERSSDAGEPRGTAGVPILQVLRGAELWDVLAVVTRWFGGTLLGKGGLARAYAAATRDAVAVVRVESQLPSAVLRLQVPIARRGALLRLLRPPHIELRSEAIAATNPEVLVLEVRIECDREASFRAALAALGLAMPE